jgi:hypothetical protein
MDEATVGLINPGQKPDILPVRYRALEIVERGGVDGDVGDEGMAVGRGRAGSNLAVAHGYPRG